MRRVTIILEDADEDALERVRKTTGQRYDADVLRALIRERDEALHGGKWKRVRR